MANAASLTGEFSGSGLGTPSVFLAPLSIHLSGAGFISSETGNLPKADGPPTDPLTQRQSGIPESLCCFLLGKRNLYSPSFTFGQKPFSFSFETTQKSSREGNLSVSGGNKIHPSQEKPHPMGAPTHPVVRCKMSPSAVKNRTIAHHCCYSAISANTLLLPPKTPKILFALRGVDCGRRGGCMVAEGKWVGF